MDKQQAHEIADQLLQNEKAKTKKKQNIVKIFRYGTIVLLGLLFVSYIIVMILLGLENNFSPIFFGNLWIMVFIITQIIKYFYKIHKDSQRKKTEQLIDQYQQQDKKT